MKYRDLPAVVVEFVLEIQSICVCKVIRELYVFLSTAVAAELSKSKYPSSYVRFYTPIPPATYPRFCLPTRPQKTWTWFSQQKEDSKKKKKRSDIPKSPDLYTFKAKPWD
eukprot:UN22819